MMVVVQHVLACLAVWLAFATSLGLFIGKFIEVGDATGNRAALDRLPKREVVDA